MENKEETKGTHGAVVLTLLILIVWFAVISAYVWHIANEINHRVTIRPACIEVYHYNGEVPENLSAKQSTMETELQATNKQLNKLTDLVACLNDN